MEDNIAYLTLLGIGSIGARVVDEVHTRYDEKRILCVTAGYNLDDLRDISVKNKHFIKDDDSMDELIAKITSTKHLLVVGDANVLPLWNDILQQTSNIGEKIIYSFIIPDVAQSIIQTDKIVSQISTMSTKVLTVPIDVFKVFVGKKWTPAEIEKLVKQYMKIAINSFIYIFEQYVVYSDSSINPTKEEMESTGRIYFSFGNNSSESVKEAFDSPLIYEETLNESRIKTLHVQFHQPISLFLAMLLGQWIEKHHIDIRSEHILIERNTNVEGVALARLWVLD
jgi:hypothetical protein